MTDIMTNEEELTRIIRLFRVEKAHLTQKDAALKANISLTYWKKIEKGKVDAPNDTLAGMLWAIEVPPSFLKTRGFDELAEEVSLRQEALGERYSDPAEAHIMSTPDVNENTKAILVKLLRVHREMDNLDPLSREWLSRARWNGK